MLVLHYYTYLWLCWRWLYDWEVNKLCPIAAGRSFFSVVVLLSWQGLFSSSDCITLVWCPSVVWRMFLALWDALDVTFWFVCPKLYLVHLFGPLWKQFLDWMVMLVDCMSLFLFGVCHGWIVCHCVPYFCTVSAGSMRSRLLPLRAHSPPVEYVPVGHFSNIVTWGQWKPAGHGPDNESFPPGQ